MTRPMVLSRPAKVLVGLLTVWPIVYMFLFFLFVAGSMFWLTRQPGDDGTGPSRPPLAFLLLFAAHCGTILLSFALIAFYLVFLFKTERVPQSQKALWAVVLLLAGFVTMPAFFYLYVWPDDGPSQAGSTVSPA